jgi:hypothetical protein
VTPRTDHPLSLVDAARALARAREAWEHLRSLTAATTDEAVELGERKWRACLDTKHAEAALDAAYRRDEYGEEAE